MVTLPRSRSADLSEILQQLLALAHRFQMTLNLECGRRIDLAVEIRLHAQAFSAFHWVLP